MLKYIFAFILLLHGLIHFMGFAKAFGYGEMKQLTIPISKPVGVLWIITAFLFVITTVLFLMKKEYWSAVAIVSIVLSQTVIFMSWKDAKFGTLANLIILIVVILSFTAARFEKLFKADASNQFQQNNTISMPVITEADLQHLPPPVQRYLQYAGVLNKPALKNMRIVFEGEMRSRNGNWFPFISVQYNFFDEPTRLFFMKGKMFGITVPGYHHYINKKAVMDIRLFGLKKIAYQEGPAMNKTETVTLFNDMCLLAPASLIDKRIAWEAIDNNKTRAVFTNGDISITAILYIDNEGKLVDFTSNDRYDVNAGKWVPFSTPVKEYRNLNGRNVISYGESVWQYPEGNFTYGKFNLKSIAYNLNEYQP